jgi:hypothetical protein
VTGFVGSIELRFTRHEVLIVIEAHHDGPQAADEGGSTMTASRTDDAVALLQQLQRGEWAPVRATFNDTLRAQLSEEALEDAWDQVTAAVGAFETLGEPSSQTVRGNEVVDVPMRFAKAELKGRVTYDDAGAVTGFFILEPHVQ